MKKILSIFVAVMLLVSAVSVTVTAAAEDAVAVTGISLSPSSKTLVIGQDDEYEIKATVTPDNATDKTVSFAFKDGAVTGVALDAATGKITVDKNAAQVGKHEIVVTAASTAGDEKPVTATFTLSLRKVSFNEAKFTEYLDAANKQIQFAMSGEFQLSNEWTKNSAHVNEIFDGIDYKVEGDEGFSKDAKYDVISVEACSPSGDRKVDGDWTSRALTSTFSMRTSGWWLFRYVVKDSGGTVLAKSSILERHAVDRDHPVVALSNTLKTKQDEGLTEGQTYSVSTSLDITDSSSTTTNYVVYKMVKGEWVQIFDSKTKEVAEGYDKNISNSGTITPLAEDVSADKTPVYKIVYSVVDAEGFFGVEEASKTTEFNPELTLFVKAAENSSTKKGVDVWKIVLYVIAGLSAVGIVVILCIKPKQKVTDPRKADGASEDKAAASYDKKDE